MGLLKWMKAIWKKLDTSRPDIVLGAEFGIPTILQYCVKLIFNRL